MPRSELMEVRLDKLRRLEEMGIQPYAYKYDIAHQISELLHAFESLAGGKAPVSAAGRIMAMRTHGRAVFMDLMDSTGQIQLYVRKDIVGLEPYSILLLLDRGDIIGVTGTLFVTRTGEKSIRVDSFELLAKSLRPLPDKWHGLQDVEIRYRQRYVDLVVNPRSREVFRKRARIIQTLRDFLDRQGFLEVETPVLQPIHGGATARPFTTYCNALGEKLYLRIADELYLKKLIVGALGAVYEFGKDFRNEGLSRVHSPEFLMLEFYRAYIDYYEVMKLVEEMLAEAAVAATGSPIVEYQGEIIDFTPPWRRLSMLEAIKQHAGYDVAEMSNEQLHELSLDLGFEPESETNRGKLIEGIFDETAQPNLIQPTFIMDYPKEISPLAKEKRGNPELTERFEPFLCGWEFGNGFSELNDPIDQQLRFQFQVEQYDLGDLEAHAMDWDYIRAMSYGMPPIGGMGIGIDRLVMILTNCTSIRDVILFPLLKPEDFDIEDISLVDGDEEATQVIQHSGNR